MHPSSRSVAWLSLGVVGASAASLMVIAPGESPFPFGGAASTVGLVSQVSQGLGLLLALLLGWAVPGLSLVAWLSPELTGGPRLARAIILGTGYLWVVSLCSGALVGHGPTTPVLLVSIAWPSVMVLFRRPPSRRSSDQDDAVVMLVLAMLVVTAVFWPKIRYGGMNGDGAEAFELASSLAEHPLPRFELEGAVPPRFGTPVTVPNLTGSFVAFARMQVLGPSEVATRLTLVVSWVLLVGLCAAWGGVRDRSGWALVLATAAVSLLWCTYYVSYKPPYDLAEPAGINMLTTVLWMAAAWEILAGSMAVGIAGLALATLTTYAAPVLGVFALIGLWWQDRERARRATVLAAVVGGLVVVAVAAYGAVTGVLPVWMRQWYLEYWLDLVDSSRRVDAWPLAFRFLLMTGGVPLLVWWRWSRLDVAGRVMLLAGSGYLFMTLAGSHKMLHYLVPLPWIFLMPAIHVSSPRVRWGGAMLLTAVFALSWPTDPSVRTSTAQLGAESCVAGYDYESAVVAAAAIYGVLERPLASDRFAIGRHTWVRYAMTLGRPPCVIGLSPELPEGAIALSDGPPAIWTVDVDRFAYWRFRPVNWAESVVFPQPERLRYETDADGWRGAWSLGAEPGRALLLSGMPHISTPDESATAGVVVGARVRLLLPIVGEGSHAVIRLVSPSDRRVGLQINGMPIGEQEVSEGTFNLEVSVGLKTGWNVLEISGAEGVTLLSLEGDAGRD